MIFFILSYFNYFVMPFGIFKKLHLNEQYVELERNLLTRSEFSRLKEFINKNEFKAFITAGNVSEVYGLA
ncbi:MAG TPA: hypothetical protein DC000_12490 [Clostridiales bacterium]|nr:hypothetical protein [Clostridiales bacterium]